MAYGIWDVSGSFIIPGARKKGTFGPVRVCAPDRHKASADIATLLNEKFRRDLKDGMTFGKHFATMNLKWEDVSAKMKLAASLAPTSEQAIKVVEAAAAE